MNLGLGDGLANVLSTVHKGGHTQSITVCL